MTRRHLLSAASASTAALALPAALRAQTGAPLVAGQIGTGHAHASGKMLAMRNLPKLWTVAGLAVPAAEAGSAGHAAYEGVPRLDEAELLALPDLQMVAVETLIEDSCTTAERCLAAGKHVHLDKPGALELDDFKRMRLAAEAGGLTVQMGYMLRYNPAFELLFRAVEEGWLGEITEIDASMGKLADPRTREEIGALPGGGMFELACHLIDIVVTLLGKPETVAPFSTPVGDDGVQDNQAAVLVYPKATAMVRCNHADPFGGPRRRFNVTGTQGTLEILPLESGQVRLSLTEARGDYEKGAQSFRLDLPKGRYDLEFVDLAKVVRGEKALAWDAAHDIAVFETVLRASGLPLESQRPEAG